jgi:hypothetical protein
MPESYRDRDVTSFLLLIVTVVVSNRTIDWDFLCKRQIRQYTVHVAMLKCHLTWQVK